MFDATAAFPSSHDPNAKDAVVPLAVAMDIGRRHYQEGRLGKAEHVFSRILRGHPHNSDALNMLGVTLLRTGRAGPAAELLDRACSLEPSNARYHNNGGSLQAANALRGG
jgi:Flp pilus assembly protein TadD